MFTRPVYDGSRADAHADGRSTSFSDRSLDCVNRERAWWVALWKRFAIGSRIPDDHRPPLGLLSIGGPLIDAGHGARARASQARAA